MDRKECSSIDHSVMHFKKLWSEFQPLRFLPVSISLIILGGVLSLSLTSRIEFVGYLLLFLGVLSYPLSILAESLSIRKIENRFIDMSFFILANNPTFSWLLSFFVMTFWNVRILYKRNTMALRQAIMDSESLFIYSYEKNACIIRNVVQCKMRNRNIKI